jgi:hypothetical protein
MYVRWQNRNRRRPAFGTETGDDIHHAAILIENVRTKGKVVSQHVAYLGGITGSAIKLPAQRRKFWKNVLKILDRLHNRLSPEQRQAIITAVAAKVPGPPTKEECEKLDQELQQTMADLTKKCRVIKEMFDQSKADYAEGKTIIAVEGQPLPITLDDCRWELSRLAYKAEQAKMLKELARASGISIKMLRRHALVWRRWMVPDEDGKSPVQRMQEKMKE